MRPMTDRDASATRRPSRFPWLLVVLTVLAAGYGAWMAMQRLEVEAGRAAAAQKAADDAAERARTAETERARLDIRTAELEKQLSDASSRAVELSQTLEQREAELQRLTATYQALEEKMQVEIRQGDIRLSQSKGQIQVDLVDKVLFDSAKAEVTPRGQEVLTRLGAILAGIADKQIQVSGHTDDSPITLPELKEKFASNWELSTARAVNVVRFLAEKASVPAPRLVAAGYGQYRPLGSNITPRGRALNRRIEILLLPSLEAKPNPALLAPATGGKPAEKRP